MRTILAGIAGVFIAIIGVIVFLLVGNEDRNAIAAETPSPEVIAERQAPATRANPMTPVTEDEAARRAELHERIAGPAARMDEAVMAPPVVTEVRAATEDDPLAREIFGTFFATPEPVLAEPAPELPQRDPEPEPEPEPEPVQEAEAPPVRVLNPADFRDRFRTDTTRPASRFGVRDLEPGIEGPLDFDSGSLIAPDALRLLIGDMQTGYLTAFGRSPDDDWFAPFQVADGYGNTGLTDPIVRPQYDFPLGYALPAGDVTGYGAPRPDERSAARPALTGVDIYGQPYTTGDQPNPYLAAQSGPIVLARSGDILMARLLYGFNSDDVRGLPIYAVISDYLPNGTVGPLDGARIQGQVAYSSHNAAIIFDTLVLANGREFPFSAIAVSADNGRPGVADRVNRHTLARYGSLFLAGIIQGVGEVAQVRLGNDGNDQPVIIINEGDGTVNVDGRSDEPSDGEILAGALAPVGRNLSTAAARGFNRPPTISAPAGMPFALVFTATLISDPAEARTAFNPRTGQIEVFGAVQAQPGPPVPIGATGPAAAMTLPETGEAFTPAGNGPPDAVWQSLGATGQ
jgi:hypothetical protein